MLRNSFQQQVRGVCSFLLILILPLSVSVVKGATIAHLRALVTIQFTPGHPINRFVLSRALGAGIDGHSEGETIGQLSPANVKAMLSAGLKPLTYRLRTELAGEAWHWNPSGSWSDSAHQQGYWTSDSGMGQPIEVCYGYRLPRRGNTIDQANNNGYSRIDDGDTQTFWKSNPYLDQHFTGERNSVNPQWVMIDLGAQKKIDAIKVVWSQPFATDFAVEYGYFVGPEDLSQRLPTDWRPFPQGAINKATGGAEILKLSSQPLTIRYVRLRLNESSGTGPDKSRDIRDRLGYAIREINLGYLDGHGGFHDAIHHAASRNAQTVVYVSSTDPWHREIDRDPETEQPGFDFVFKSGLTNGLPLLLPVAVLYDTPENAAAEIQYLKARGYPFEQVEMGEEPDGQFVNAEHFAALYLQFAKAIHRVRPELHLGGPSMQDIEQSQVPGQIDFGKAGWLGRFLRYLKAHDKLDEFSFFSFEWYPFGDDCEPRKFLPRSTQMMADALDELQQGGLKHDIPWIITEYGYSAFAARAEVDIDGALFNADLVAFFLTRGGDAAYLYGYEASEIIREQKCSAGNNMMFFRGDSGHERKPTATYWVARMLTQDWAKPGDELHEMYAAESTVHDHEGNATVTAYALRRLDGLWSLLLINRSPSTSYETTLRFQNASNGASSAFIGSLDLFQYSHAQYQLNSDRYNPYPIRDEPPAHETIRADQDSGIVLPPSSITVVRGQVGGL